MYMDNARKDECVIIIEETTNIHGKNGASAAYQSDSVFIRYPQKDRLPECE